MITLSFYSIIITIYIKSNLVSGRKVSTIQNAHDNQEITCCKLDSSQRRLFTAGTNGTIKVKKIN